MPRPSINLERFQAEISNLYQNGTNPLTIANIINNQYGIKVGERMIKTRLSIWGIQKSNRMAARDTVLHARIKVLIYQVGLSDEEILHTLGLEGYDIQARTLRYIRHQKGFLRRLANPGYEIGFLHQHFKNQGFLIGSNRHIFFYIIWVYVGISSRTVVSMLRQFLDTLAITQQQPRLVRSDRGTETVLLAEAPYKLQQSLHPEINIRDCYLYEYEYFYALQEEGKFSINRLGDRIALYTIYMPLIQTQITSFVRTWNQHQIRKQSNRPYLVPGKPWMNYHFPPTGVVNEGIQFDMDLFKQLQKYVKDWDTDQYLPPDTYTWTRNQLLELLFDPQQPPSAAGDHALTPFYTIYLDLRARIQAYIETGSQLILQLSQPLTGAFAWDPWPNPNRNKELELVQEIEVGYNQDQVGGIEGLEN
ncbi:hypothetical protein BDV12DRAFT_191372 [Aspergillus spectabilis]